MGVEIAHEPVGGGFAFLVRMRAEDSGAVRVGDSVGQADDDAVTRLAIDPRPDCGFDHERPRHTIGAVGDEQHLGLFARTTTARLDSLLQCVRVVRHAVAFGTTLFLHVNHAGVVRKADACSRLPRSECGMDHEVKNAQSDQLRRKVLPELLHGFWTELVGHPFTSSRASTDSQVVSHLRAAK